MSRELSAEYLWLASAVRKLLKQVSSLETKLAGVVSTHVPRTVLSLKDLVSSDVAQGSTSSTSAALNPNATVFHPDWQLDEAVCMADRRNNIGRQKEAREGEACCVPSGVHDAEVGSVLDRVSLSESEGFVVHDCAAAEANALAGDGFAAPGGKANKRKSRKRRTPCSSADFSSPCGHVDADVLDSESHCACASSEVLAGDVDGSHIRDVAVKAWKEYACKRYSSADGIRVSNLLILCLDTLSCRSRWPMAKCAAIIHEHKDSISQELAGALSQLSNHSCADSEIDLFAESTSKVVAVKLAEGLVSLHIEPESIAEVDIELSGMSCEDRVLFQKALKLELSVEGHSQES